MNQSVKDVVQCQGKTLKSNKQKQCKKRTARSDKCWIHLQKENNLRVKKSIIPNAGFGLFSGTRRISKNKIISKFTGRKTTKRALDRMYGQNQSAYGVCRGNYCIDANLTSYSAARYANDGFSNFDQYGIPKYKQNAKIYSDSSKGPADFYLVATRNILPNREIITNYDGI